MHRRLYAWTRRFNCCRKLRRIDITVIGDHKMNLRRAGIGQAGTATTHWNYCEELGNNYPGVKVQPNDIFFPAWQCVYVGRCHGRHGPLTGFD